MIEGALHQAILAHYSIGNNAQTVTTFKHRIGLVLHREKLEKL